MIIVLVYELFGESNFFLIVFIKQLVFNNIDINFKNKDIIQVGGRYI